MLAWLLLSFYVGMRRSFFKANRVGWRGLILGLLGLGACASPSPDSLSVDALFDLDHEIVASSQSAILAIIAPALDGSVEVLASSPMAAASAVELTGSFDRSLHTHIVLLTFAESYSDSAVHFVLPEAATNELETLIPTGVFFASVGYTSQRIALTPVNEAAPSDVQTFSTMIHIAIEEVEPSPPPSPTPLPVCDNVALGKRVMASGDAYPGTDPNMATDGIVGEPHWAGYGPQFAIIDLGQDTLIEGIKVRPLGDSGPDHYFYVFAWNVSYALDDPFGAGLPNTFLDFTEVEKLSGGGTWVEPGVSITDGWPEGSNGGNAVHDPRYDQFQFSFAPVQARYVKIDITQGDLDTDSNLQEVEICRSSGL